MLAETYLHPSEYINLDGTRRFAFVTFLAMNDSYLPGALMLAYGLRRQQTRADLVCLVTPEISYLARSALHVLFDRVIEVETIWVDHKRKQGRQYLPYVFTRIHALRMGRDGDLGPGYDKIVLLDADVFPMAHYDHLFLLEAPAGIINEQKAHFLEWDADGRYVVTSDMRTTGRWIWHRIYDPICPHGHRIPRQITDRVKQDPANMGLNGSLYVLEPSVDEFWEIMFDLERPTTRRLVGDLFPWPDMQYLTMRWSGRWTNVDLRFSSYKGYPTLEVLCGTHYAGFKPWFFKQESAMARYSRYVDFQLWFQWFAAMLQGYPQLKRFKGLRRLEEKIRRYAAWAE